MDDPKKRATLETRDKEDREAILARRNRFVAAALSGMAGAAVVAACTPRPCLEPMPSPGNTGAPDRDAAERSDGAVDASATTVDAAAPPKPDEEVPDGAPPAKPVPPKPPSPTPMPPGRDGGSPAPCLSMPPPRVEPGKGPGPMPCLSVAPRVAPEPPPAPKPLPKPLPKPKP
ncbi:MAG: hypothetical protein IPG50_33445 [Myxococcales bacterium]|nr:hypothetical protein [Myxococcales bacterium]